MTERIAPRNPEHVNPPPPMDGLHGRLVLADQKFLRANEPVQTTDTAVVSFEQRNYNPFEKASEKNRETYWESKGVASFDAQKQRWTESLTSSLTQPNNHDIFTKLSPVFQKTGVMDANVDHFSNTHANSIYQRYFDGEHPGGVKRFVQDVLETYTTNGRVDMQAVNQNMTTIRWFSNVFGVEGKAMVTELITAEAKLKTTPDFVTKLTTEPANNVRINTLNPEEKAILKFIADAGGIEDQPQRNQPLPNTDETPLAAEEDEEEEETPLAPGERPIHRKKEEILAKLKDQDTIFVIGGTGSGKTFFMPQFILETLNPDDKFVITEPRQVNAASIATGIAGKDDEGKSKVGQRVGYQHGDETMVNKNGVTTQMLFATEGTLLGKIMRDPLLKEFNYVMVDEVHIRSTDTEQLLYYLKEAQRLRKEQGKTPLKLIITSATVNKNDMIEKLGIDEEKGYIEVKGKAHPIEEHFLPEDAPPITDMAQAAADKVDEIITSDKEGDIMIFVAGNRDINSITNHINEKKYPNLKVIKLHSGATEADKKEVGEKAAEGQRRVIIATNYAETGVTIAGMAFVINTGKEFEKSIDPNTGLEVIKEIDQSKANADQRRGRVGRDFPGVLYNLFTKSDYERRGRENPYPTPEIKRSDLTDLILKMKKRGIEKIEDMKLLSSPLPPERVKAAIDTLQQLDAITPDGKLTDIGKKMAEIRTDYTYARMLVEAEKMGKGIAEICAIAAVDQARNIYDTSEETKHVDVTTKDRYKHPTSDFLTLLRVWKAFEASGFNKDWAEKEGLNYPVLMKAKNSRDKLLDGFRTAPKNDATEEELQKIITQGFKHRILRRNANTNDYLWEKAKTVRFQGDRHSSLFHMSPKPELIILGNAGGVKSNGVSYIDKYQIVKPEWLPQPVAA